MRTIAIKAEGLRAGSATRVCVNLVADSLRGDGLVICPGLPPMPDEAADEEYAAATVREPWVWAPVRWRVNSTGEMWQPLQRFVAKDADTGSVAALTQSELRKYSDGAMNAYGALCARVEGAGLFMQPVMVRYRLTDAAGRTVFESQPSVAGLPQGWQCVEPLEAEVTQLSQGIEIGETLIRAETFSLEAVIPDYSDRPEVSLVELEVSGMLHPVDGAKDAAVALRKTNSGSPVAVIALPGATSWMADLGTWRARRLEQTADRCEEMMHIARRLPAAATTVSIPPVGSGVSSAWMAGTEPSEGRLSGASRAVAECSIPHGMKARVSVWAGDSVVHGAITPLLWPGAHPAELIVASGTESAATERIPAVTRVWFGSKMLERSGEIERFVGHPLLMAPMVAYPHPGATKIEVIATLSDGSREGATVELHPNEAMSRAVWVSPGLVPISLSDSYVATVASSAPEVEERGGMVAVCGADSPALPVAASTVGGGRITALISADRSLTSWDASRGRLYAITTEGVLGVTVSAARGEIAAMVLSSQQLTGVARCGSTIYAAGTGGVMRLAGTALAVVAPTPKSVAGICADEASGLVMVRLADGELRAMDADGTMTTVSQPASAVEWEATVTTRPGERLTEALVCMRATHFSGALEIYGSGPGGRVRIVRLDIDGAVERPLLLRHIAAPHRARLTVRLAGTATSLRLTGAELIVSQSGSEKGEVVAEMGRNR